MKQECYGKIFPDLLEFSRNRTNRGHVFSALVRSFGVGIQDRNTAVDLSAWEKCLACPDYRTCYDLSLAKLILQQAVLERC